MLKLNEAGFAKRRALLEAQTKKNRPFMSTAESPAGGAKGKDAKGKKGESSRKRGRDAGMETVGGGVFILNRRKPSSSNGQK